MNLPKIDLSSLPGLDTVTGLFGSMEAGPGSDDTIIEIMVYVYEVINPETML